MPQITIQQAIDTAIEHHHAGRLKEAERIYRLILARIPDHPDALRLLGVLAGQAGHHDAGLDLIRRAIAIEPNIPEYFLNLGAALADAKRPDEAIAAYGRALELNPDYFEARVNLGNVLKNQGQLDAAISAYAQVAELRPQLPEAHNNLGVALTDAKRYDEAIAALRQAISLRPDYAEAHYNLGNTLTEKGLLEEAVVAYRQSLRFRSEDADTFTNLGIALTRLSRLDEAIVAHQHALQLNADNPTGLASLGKALSAAGQFECALEAYQQALRLRPGCADSLRYLGDVLQKMKRYDEAIDAYRQALGERENYPKAWKNLADALYKTLQVDAAIDACRAAIRFDPDYHDAHDGLGVALAKRGLHAEARASYERALALDPLGAQCHSNFGMLLLVLGDFQRGWAEYQWRLRAPENIKRFAGRAAQPLWDGENLNGRTILLEYEQGFGDAIQCVRYAPMVAGRGGRVILECPPPLFRLFQNIAGVERVICSTDLPAFDVRCPLMSLPLIFDARLDTIPSDVPYVKVDDTLLGTWVSKLPRRDGRRRVGLAWAGNPDHPNDARRSIPFSQIAHICQTPGITFVSLQKEPDSRASGSAGSAPRTVASQTYEPVRGADPTQNANSRFKLVDFSKHLNDFADTAALISQLDLVIAVDSAVAHLAGALGKPVWVLLPFTPDWRWMLDREDSPWYPTMRLFRQKTPGNWTEVIERVVGNLGIAPQNSPRPDYPV